MYNEFVLFPFCIEMLYLSQSLRNGRRHKIDQTKRKRLIGNVVGQVIWMEEG